MAAEVIAMYAQAGPDAVWPELAVLSCWDGKALVVTSANKDALAALLLDLCNYYDELAEGRCPTSDGEPVAFCRAASLGLGTAWRRVMESAP